MPRGSVPNGIYLPHLAQWRTWAGLSQQELAKLAHVSVWAVRAYEQGVKMPRYATVQLMADAIGVDRVALVSMRPEEVGRLIYNAKLARELADLSRQVAADMVKEAAQEAETVTA